MTQEQIFKNFDDFYAQFNGHSVDFDGAYGAQCVDLVQAWSWYINGPRFVGDYAYQIYGQFPNFYQSILNGKDNSPQKGDIVVFNVTFNGWAGDVVIATGKGKSVGKPDDWFECFGQNFPTGQSPILRNSKYDYVIGWLRPIITTTVDPYIAKFSQLKISIDRLKSETDVLNSQSDKKGAFDSTMVKIKKINETGSL